MPMTKVWSNLQRHGICLQHPWLWVWNMVADTNFTATSRKRQFIQVVLVLAAFSSLLRTVSISQQVLIYLKGSQENDPAFLVCHSFVPNGTSNRCQHHLMQYPREETTNTMNAHNLGNFLLIDTEPEHPATPVEGNKGWVAEHQVLTTSEQQESLGTTLPAGHIGKQAALLSATIIAKDYAIDDPKNSFAACLMLMDDNHFLIEWLAYHAHVLVRNTFVDFRSVKQLALIGLCFYCCWSLCVAWLSTLMQSQRQLPSQFWIDGRGELIRLFGVTEIFINCPWIGPTTVLRMHMNNTFIASEPSIKAVHGHSRMKVEAGLYLRMLMSTSLSIHEQGTWATPCTTLPKNYFLFHPRQKQALSCLSLSKAFLKATIINQHIFITTLVLQLLARTLEQEKPAAL